LRLMLPSVCLVQILLNSGLSRCAGMCRG